MFYNYINIQIRIIIYNEFKKYFNKYCFKIFYLFNSLFKTFIEYF